MVCQEDIFDQLAGLKMFFVTDMKTNCLLDLWAGLKIIGPIAPNWAPRSILQSLLQVDWEPLYSTRHITFGITLIIYINEKEM